MERLMVDVLLALTAAFVGGYVVLLWAKTEARKREHFRQVLDIFERRKGELPNDNVEWARQRIATIEYIQESGLVPDPQSMHQDLLSAIGDLARTQMAEDKEMQAADAPSSEKKS